MMKRECEYCERVPVKSIADMQVNDDNWIFDISGPNIRFFDDNYPGVLDAIPINHCPMCGRRLRCEMKPKYRCPLYAAFWNWFIPMSPHYEEWLTPMDWLRLKIGHRLPVPKRKEMGT